MRIIAGKARGRIFEAPQGKDTRPTLDRVREAIFGMIQFDVENRKVLDLFAGSGGLGLEALSRGASKVVFCDIEKKAVKLIEKNIATLDFADNAKVFCCDWKMLINKLGAEGERFSVVLIDPPYSAGLYEEILSEIVKRKVLKNGAIIIAEHAWDKPIDTQILPEEIGCSLEFRKTRRYGSVGVTYITYVGGEQ